MSACCKRDLIIPPSLREMTEQQRQECLDRLAEKVLDRLRYLTTEDLSEDACFVYLKIEPAILKDDE